MSNVTTKLTVDDKRLRDFYKNIIGQEKKRVNIGILGSTNNRDDEQTNAQVGLKQEFGSLSEGIPARSFLRMPLEYKKNDLVRAVGGKMITRALMDGDLGKALKLLGISAEAIIGKAFKSKGFGKWPSNAPSTIVMKGGNTPLINTRQLQRAITSKVVDK